MESEVRTIGIGSLVEVDDKVGIIVEADKTLYPTSRITVRHWDKEQIYPMYDIKPSMVKDIRVGDTIEFKYDKPDKIYKEVVDKITPVTYKRFVIRTTLGKALYATDVMDVRKKEDEHIIPEVKNESEKESEKEDETLGSASRPDRFIRHTGAAKDDSNKLDWTLFPSTLIEPVVEVFNYGAEKYAPHNWRGLTPRSLFAAVHRHLHEHQIGLDALLKAGKMDHEQVIEERGEEFDLLYDSESDLLHIDHAITSLIMYREQLINGMWDKVPTPLND